MGARVENRRFGRALQQHAMGVRASPTGHPAPSSMSSPPDWVVLTGRGQRIWGDECGFTTCDGDAETKMISPDGMRGEMPEFARGARDGGTRALKVLYYYSSPRALPTGIRRLETRVQRKLDARRPACRPGVPVWSWPTRANGDRSRQPRGNYDPRPACTLLASKGPAGIGGFRRKSIAANPLRPRAGPTPAFRTWAASRVRLGGKGQELPPETGHEPLA